MKSMKGQASTEIFVILGVVALLMIPLLLLAYSKMNEMTGDVAISQADIAATRLANTADAVGNIGNNASIITEIDIPPGVTGFSVSGRELVFRVRKDSYETQVVKLSRFNLTISDDDREKLSSSGTFNVEVRAEPGISKDPVVTLSVS